MPRTKTAKAPEAPKAKKRATRAKAAPVQDHSEHLSQAFEVVDPKTPRSLKRLLPKKATPPTPTTWEGLRRAIWEANRKRNHAMELRIGLTQKVNDRKSKKTGQLIPSSFNDDDRAMLKPAADVYEALEKEATKEMVRLVRAHPLWNQWMKDVDTITEITAGVLLAYIDFTRCEKPSSLNEFCGVGFHRKDGELVSQRPRSGLKLDYIQEIKCALYVWAGGLDRGKRFEGVANSRYRKRLVDKKEGLKLSHPDKAPWWHQRTAQRCAERLLVEDIYTVGRTLMGLHVWPDYHAARSGYSHGGKVCVNAPRRLTIEQAKRLVNGEDIGAFAPADGVQALPFVPAPVPVAVVEPKPAKRAKVARVKAQPEKNELPVQPAKKAPPIKVEPAKRASSARRGALATTRAHVEEDAAGAAQ